MPTELEISGGYYSGGDYASFNEWDFSGNFHPDSTDLSKEARDIYNSFSQPVESARAVENVRVVEKMESAPIPAVFPQSWFILLFILLIIIIIQLSCIFVIVLLKTRKLN